ncbi:MAG TPA: AI-2E family transporter [Gemmatimonadaceae bacterium]|nr:AI-2E family transporter [Gemmatimonadaceae bacterium]
MPDPAPAPPPPETSHGGWRSRDVLRAALLVALVYVAGKLLWFAHVIVFVTFLGILFGLALSAGVDRLERRRVPRALGAASIVLALLGAGLGLGFLTAPALTSQWSQLQRQLPDAIDSIERWINEHRGGVVGVVLGGSGTTPADSARVPEPVAARSTDSLARVRGDTSPGAAQRAGAAASPDTGLAKAPVSLRNEISNQVGGLTQHLFPFLSSTLSVLAGVLLVVFLAIYLSIEPALYRNGVLHLVPHRLRARAAEVMTALGFMLRRWLVTQLIAMAVIGTVSTIVLFALHVKAALALGLLAGLLEFVPIFGPILSAVPAVAMGFLDSPEKALWVVIAYIVIQQMEAHLLIPLLMREGMDLPPVLTILAQALMALLFGFIGLLVAVPVLASVLVPVKMLYVEGVVGDDVHVPGDDDTGG